MMRSKEIFLSHLLDGNTPSYGNRNRFDIVQKSSIANGDIANDSTINTTVHIGTHIDMPYHFHAEGQTIEDFPADFWTFKKPALICVEPKSLILYEEIIEAIDQASLEPQTDLLIIKTGIEAKRAEISFWQENPGLSPDLYEFFLSRFPKLRVVGFDSISVSSFANRTVGREAHKRFLNPERPLLLLEDMHLETVNETTRLLEVLIAPLRIAKCDGLPCTVLAKTEE